MKIAQELLGRYAHIRPPHGAIKKEIIRIVASHTGIRLEVGDIDIQNRTARILGSSATRQRVFLNRTAILEDLKDHTGQGGITDIR